MKSYVQHVLLALYLIQGIFFQIKAARIYYEKCEYKGFSCNKSKNPGKYDITFSCNPLTTWDIEIYLWQFRAPSTVSNVHICNCTSVKLNLVCTNEGRAIQSLRLSNITNLSITPLQYGLPQLPPEFILEDILNMENIPSRTFLQTRKFPYLKYGCASLKDLESIKLKNVHIKIFEREAFHSLVDMKNLIFENITVDRIEAVSIQVFMAKNSTFKIIQSSFGVLEYMSLFIRGNSFEISNTNIQEMHSTCINATVYSFNFHSNTIGYLHAQSMSVLAQNIKILDSNFDYISSGAFQGMGPGLPENSLRSFGQLKFLYEFRNNLIESLEVGSLHSDWKSYKNVGSVVVFSYNAIKCTCAELAWLGAKEGFGKEFSNLDDFHEIVLNKENNNICADAPCILPIRAVQLIITKDGKCLPKITQEYLCNIFHPPSTTTTSTTTTSKSTALKTYKSYNPILYQRLTVLNNTSSNSCNNKITVLALVMSLYLYFYFCNVF